MREICCGGKLPRVTIEAIERAGRPHQVTIGPICESRMYEDLTVLCVPARLVIRHRL